MPSQSDQRIQSLQHQAGPDQGTADLLWALHRLAVATAEIDVVLARHLGLRATDYLALKHLIVAEAPLGPVELGRLLGLSSGSATELADRLERSGHVLRQPHPHDRRRRVLTASPDAIDALTNQLQPISGALTGLAADFTAEQRIMITTFLDRVAEHHHSYGRTATDDT